MPALENLPLPTQSFSCPESFQIPFLWLSIQIFKVCDYVRSTQKISPSKVTLFYYICKISLLRNRILFNWIPGRKCVDTGVSNGWTSKIRFYVCHIITFNLLCSDWGLYSYLELGII
jgi:hypothetical protein